MCCVVPLKLAEIARLKGFKILLPCFFMDKSKKKISDSKDLLMVSLSKFYHAKSNLADIIKVIEGESEISLRLIDWFVTNYSKKHNTIIRVENDHNVLHFNVYLSYRSQLKAYSKQMFDPFRRRDRIKFQYDHDKYMETTIGQLNFFRWVIQNNLLAYIAQHKEDIEADMVKTQKDNQKKKGNEDNMKIKEIITDTGNVIVQKRKKRNQLSKSNLKNMNLFSGHRVIQFD